ncbi:MAG: sigma-70 family RNA polymerase sigma factor [Bacteroidetes bacterium]|nr:MAG: sigma-70 family RNA polymerase sigma factor [Bacteroidota bacterium]
MDNNMHNEFGDEEIIRRIRYGSESELNGAVECLRQRYYGKVVQIVKTYGGYVRADAGIVFNDAIITLIEKVRDGTYKPRKSRLQTYLMSIAKNHLKNHLRKEHKHRTGELFDGLLKIEYIEKMLESKEILEKIVAALQKLEEPCREVLRKSLLEGKSMKEISEEVGARVDAVKQRNHRCKKKLRDLLNDDFGDWFKNE